MSGEPRWTPGPWVCFYKQKYDEWHVSVPVAGASFKAGLFPDGIPTGEHDARLIAAAPDMAEALAGIEQTAREYVRNWPNSPTVRAPWGAVLAALAKARGEQG